MTVAETVRVSSEIIDKAVNEIVMEIENNGFKRGELKPFLEKLSEKYDVSYNTLRNRYYKEIKTIAKPNVTKKSKTLIVKKENVEDENVEDENQKQVTEDNALIIRQAVDKPKKPKGVIVDESVKKFAEIPADKIFNYPKDYYKLGQLVEVKVVNVQNYGVFCEILDGKGFQALCHISEIVDGFIKNVTDYLDVGDIIKDAKICLIDNKKINVTMKHLDLRKREEYFLQEVPKLPENPPVNVIGEKFGNLKDKLLSRAVQKDKDEAEMDNILSEELLSEEQEEIVKKYEKDIEQMTGYLQEQLGVLTPQAKLELANILAEHGVFNTTRLMMKTQENFQADIGLLFMRQMKEKVGDYL